MGAMWTDGERLSAEFIELVGYKLGLAISNEELRAALDRIGADPELADAPILRLRSEEYEELVAAFLAQFGDPDAGAGTVPPAMSVMRSLSSDEIPFAEQVLDAALPLLHTQIEAAAPGGKLDPSPIERVLEHDLGPGSVDIFRRLLAAMTASQLRSPWSRIRRQEWPDLVSLGDLFSTEQTTATLGSFFDQRLVDYLQANFTDIDAVNWRRFEALTAEFFARLGMSVELGPGRGDDGIDVRAWTNNPDKAGEATIVMQCKREKRRISKTVIKALAADVEYEGAELGLLVTTSSLSPGAKTVVETRGYPILEADRDAVHRWLELMRTPGVGGWLLDGPEI